MTIATRIEKAYGANLTGNPASWVWTDVSAYALGSVTVTAGRGDEATQTQPSRCTFRLKNTDGRFSPRLPSSPYYPNVRRQTPVRISLNPGTGYVQVFQGYVDDITPSWPSGNSEYAEVTVTASGLLRRLQQGSSPIKSALFRAISQSGPVAYWPLEDGANAVQAVSGLAGGTPMMVTSGKVVFAGASGLPSSAPLADFASGGVGGTMIGGVPAGTSTTAWRVEFVTKFNAFAPAAFAAALQWFTSGTISLWEIDGSPVGSGGLYIQYITAGGTPGGPFVSNVRVDDNNWHHIRVDASQSGGNIALTVKLDGATVITQTLTTQTMGAVNTVIINPTGDQTEEVPSIGHITVWAPFSSSIDTVTAFNGYVGESAGARIVRLCGENGVPVSVSSTTGTTPMGPQTVAPLPSLLRECEFADGGILYDGQGAGLNYLARKDRHNLPVSMALDTKLQQVKLPFAPAEDDQRIRNDWTLTRVGGSFARFTDPVHIAANGLYDTSATINNGSDGELLNQAAWRVHLGTVEEMRVPGLSLQLVDRPELWASWFATTLGERMTVANLPAQYPPGILDLILEGYTQTWDSSSWRVDLNTSPYQPWNVDALGTTFRLELAGQTLNANLNPGATTLSLATAAGYNLFTTSARFPGDFPMDLNIGGWQIHVTDASGSSSPQTLTIDPAPNTTTISSGTKVSLWRPACLAL